MDEDEKSPTLSDVELEKVAGGWPNFGGYAAPTIQHRLHKIEKKSEEKKEDAPKWGLS